MDSTGLSSLRNKLLSETKELEEKLKERRDKIKAIDLVFNMLIEEGGGEAVDKSVEIDSTRFRKMGLQEAILMCMEQPIIRWWSVVEIKKALMAGRLKTKAKDPYSAITATLDRLVERGKVEVEKTTKARKFRIKDQSIESLLPETKSREQ